MKSSSLHRSNLSREKMSLIEDVKPRESYDSLSPDFDRYMKFQKKPELDVLWRDFEKSVQSKSRAKAPVVYAGIGFFAGLILGIVFMLIVGISTIPSMQQTAIRENSKTQTESKVSVAIVPSVENEEKETSTEGLEEKYTVKSGDTLDKIAYRFYGKYDPDKIEKIMRINNISDETRIQIGQILTIPMD